MGGLLSSAMPMTVFKAEEPGHLDLEGLRKGAFSDAIDPDGVKSGWVGLGSMIDTENFTLAGNDSRFSAFSHRIDSRKIPAAVARLQLAEKIREEEAEGKKVSRKRKKELKEEIAVRLEAAADFTPSLTDCLWDAEKGLLIIGSTSEKTINYILKHFEACFHKPLRPIESDEGVRKIFNEIHMNNGARFSSYSAQPLGTASMAGLDESSQPSSISAKNNLKAVSEALERGFDINKICLIATDNNNEESQFVFCVDDKLQVNGVRFPKKERDSADEAVFLINAQICADTAQMLFDMIESKQAQKE